MWCFDHILPNAYVRGILIRLCGHLSLGARGILGGSLDGGLITVVGRKIETRWKARNLSKCTNACFISFCFAGFPEEAELTDFPMNEEDLDVSEVVNKEELKCVQT